jgi:DNA polymerase
MSYDFETRCDRKLKGPLGEGTSRYFASPHFRPLLLAYGVEKGDIGLWRWGEPCPPRVDEHIRSGGLIKAFTANFERGCLNWLAEHCGWPRPRDDQYRCSAAESAAMGLPFKLERVTAALGLAERKDQRGETLIKFFSNPRRRRKDDVGEGPFWHEPEDYPERFAEFGDYCRQDTITEIELGRRLFRLSDYEQEVWNLDHKINRRGIRIDRASCEATLDLVEKAKTTLDAEMAELTNNAVPKCTNVAALVQWVQAQGVEMTSARKDQIETLLLSRGELPQRVVDALELRQEAGKTSTSKIAAFLRRADSDDRLRDTYVYHAAGPGRWSNKGANLGNLARPRKDYEDAVELGSLQPSVLFQVFHKRDPALLPLLYGPKLGRPLHLVSDAMRGFLWAAPGHDFIAVDYSGIQGVVIAWLMGEEWKLQAFREINADPSLPDMYVRTAAAILNCDVKDITKYLRQALGKTSELSLGFEGGVAAFVTMALAYNIDLQKLYGPVWESADEDTRGRAQRRHEACKKSKHDKVKTDVISREAWLACEIIKRGWRAKHERFQAGWRELGDAMRNAIRYPGKQFTACKITFKVAKGFLLAQLPSGRCLCYGAPRLKDQVWAKMRYDDGSWPEQAETMDRTVAERLERLGECKVESTTAPAVSALGTDALSGNYVRFSLYNGLASENVTMGVERDILVHGMFNVERAGYPINMHTYDELVAEVPRGWGSTEEMERLMLDLPEWGADIPLAAHGFRAKRYRK